MTNAEKQAQTIHLTGVDIATAPQYGATGLGAYPGMGCATPASLAKQNMVQAYFLNHSRLGIPVTFHFETLHGGVGVERLFSLNPAPAGRDVGCSARPCRWPHRRR